MSSLPPPAGGCPSGHWDGQSCVPDNPAPGPLPVPKPDPTPKPPAPTPPPYPGACPAGQHPDPVSGACVTNPGPNPALANCPAGTHSNGQACVPDPGMPGGDAPIPGWVPGTNPTAVDSNCPGGMHWNANAKECRPGDAGVGAAGAGGGGGGGGGGTGSLTNADMFASDDANIKGWIDKLMSGEMSLFGPDYMNQQESQLFQAGQGRLRQSTDEINHDLISRGIGRSAVGSELTAGAGRTFQSDYSKGVRDLLVEKTRSDIEMKLKGLDAMQKWLDDRRQFIVQSESNAVQREIGLANVRLGYARIASEKELLQMQLNARVPPGPDYSALFGLLPGITPPVPKV